MPTHARVGRVRVHPTDGQPLGAGSSDHIVDVGTTHRLAVDDSRRRVRDRTVDDAHGAVQHELARAPLTGVDDHGERVHATQATDARHESSGARTNSRHTTTDPNLRAVLVHGARGLDFDVHALGNASAPSGGLGSARASVGSAHSAG